MANSIFEQFGQNTANPMQVIINQFNDFKRTVTGNPKQMVESLLQSGQMSQAQFNQLSQMANQMAGYLK